MARRLLIIACIFLSSISISAAQTPSPDAMTAARSLVSTMKLADQYRALLPAILLGLKPAPDMLVRALESFSVDRSDAAFVGDSEADLRAAQSCGVRFYGIAPNATARDRLLAASATEIFASPAALAIRLNLPIARA